MSTEAIKQTRRIIIILFVLYWVLLLSLTVAGNIIKIRGPIENFWQLWCHNWPERAGDLLFGGGFLMVGFAIIFFPKRVIQVLMQDEDGIPYWKLLLFGVAIIWPGIKTVSGLFVDWVTYCYP